MSTRVSDRTNLVKSIKELEEKIKNEDYVDEWESCKQVDGQYNASHFSIAALPDNINKNRYWDVLASMLSFIMCNIQ
jgi:hypothetical protein